MPQYALHDSYQFRISIFTTCLLATSQSVGGLILLTFVIPHFRCVVLDCDTRFLYSNITSRQHTATKVQMCHLFQNLLKAATKSDDTRGLSTTTLVDADNKKQCNLHIRMTSERCFKYILGIPTPPPKKIFICQALQHPYF